MYQNNVETPTPESVTDSASIPPNYQNLANWIRTKKYGKNVREAIAQVAEREGANDTKASNALSTANDLKNQWENGISGTTSNTELINLRTDESQQVFKTAKNRVDSIQQPYLRWLSNSVHIEPTSVDRFNLSMNRCNQLEMDYTLVPMVNITSDSDSNPQTMDDSILEAAIERCQEGTHSIVMLKPHLGVSWSDGYARKNYNPSSLQTFFSNWETILLKYAEICDTKNIPILCLSCETLILFSNDYLNYWKTIVDDIKSNYPNLLLTVAHNGWMDTSKTDIFGLVDLIGINWYPTWVASVPSDDASIPSSSELMRYALGNFQNYLQINIEEYDKPVYFTETGIEPSLPSLMNLLSNNSTDDYAVTSAVINSFITYFSKIHDVVGVSWWGVESPFQLGDVSAITSETEAFTKTAAENAWENMCGKYYAKKIYGG